MTAVGPTRRRGVAASAGLCAALLSVLASPPRPAVAARQHDARAAAAPVVRESITFVDTSRSAPARGAYPGSSERVLVTDIRRPRHFSGRLPLIVFLHGYDSDPAVYETLLDTWAAAGFFVAAPVIPSSSDLWPGPPVSDYPNEARDASFVLTALQHRFATVLDPTRVAVAGHSDGATDVVLLALNPAFADHRFRAYLSLSGEIPPTVAGPWNAVTPGSLLVTVGSSDQYGLSVWSRQVYDTAHMAKAMVVELGGDHLGSYIGASPGASELRAETLSFLRVALGSRPTSAQLGAALLVTATPAVRVLR